MTEAPATQRQGILWGACDPGLMGFLALRDGWIDQFRVLPGHQRHGLGSALLARARTASPTLRLRTCQRNHPARAFHERHGVTCVEKTDGARNEEREPDALCLCEARP